MREIIGYPAVVVAMVFWVMALFAGCHRHLMDQRQIHVVFRFDDYSAVSSTDTELRIINAFRNNDASVTFGVIPFVTAGDIHDPSCEETVPLSPTKADILKRGLEDGTLDVALHGYSHQTITDEQWTEFSGLDFDRQLARLTRGKAFLEDMIDAPVTAFVPPWNRYDANTLQALELLGFSTLSAGRKGAATEDSSLNFLPFTTTLSRLRDTVESARTSSETHPVIVVLFHEYDFREIDGDRGRLTYQGFSDLLDWLKDQQDVSLLSVSQAAEAINDLSAERFLSRQGSERTVSGY